MNKPGIPAMGVQYVRSAATANMKSQVRIQRPAVPTYDPITGRAVGTRQSYVGYSGEAHIAPVTSAGMVYTGETLTPIDQVKVSIPWNATPVPRNEDQVVITVDEDPSLVDKTLRITDISSGGIGFPVRVLTCTLVDPNPFNPGA